MRRRRVLVVEDDRSIGQVVADVLADEDYEVRWVMDGRAALTVLAEWRPNVIVLDLTMPVMDGRAFRREQCRLPGDAARVPVVVLSGLREARVIAEDLGAVAALSKPFDLDDLLATVGRVLERRPV